MIIRHQLRGGVGILTLEGDFIGEPDRQALATNVQQLVTTGCKQFVVDLRGVHHINSSGLGSLVSTLTTLRKLGGEMCLTGANHDVRNLFEMTQLFKIFRFHDTVEKALTGYAPGAPKI
jgi:anti-sigma B factor antagonist